MTKHNTNSILPPPAQVPLVLIKSKEAYRIWHAYLTHIKRIDRYTIGITIDEEFRGILAVIFRATFAYDKFEKLSLVSQAIAKADILKFFLQIGWEQKMLEHTIYGQLIILLDEVGRMLGGWKKNLQEKTPTNK